MWFQGYVRGPGNSRGQGGLDGEITFQGVIISTLVSTLLLVGGSLSHLWKFQRGGGRGSSVPCKNGKSREVGGPK